MSTNKESSRTESVYISGGCNRCPKSLDWGGNQNQLIYAVSNSVALMSDREPFSIQSTFNRHKDKINCVKWISLNDSVETKKFNKNEFASASKDKTVIVWQGNDTQYHPFQILEGHTNNVTIVDGMYYNDLHKEGSLNTFLASASVDSTVRIWSRHSDDFSLDNENSKFKLDQVITSKMNGFALALKFYQLPLSKFPILLIGFENHKIELHVRLHNETENIDRFYCLHTLIGHEDWIRDIDVCRTSDNQLLIASCAQDNYIRLWKLDSTLNETTDQTKSLVIEEDNVNNKLVNEDKALVKNQNLDDDDEDDIIKKNPEKIEEELKLKSSLFSIHSKKLNQYIQYSIKLDSVLYGHEDWIYTVKFHPRINNTQPLILISASMDKTMVLWKYDNDNAIWIDTARAGDIGGNTLGFYGATFEPNGEYIVAHGYQGALHLWKRDPLDKNESLQPAVINGGHFDLVEDICWEPDQSFLLSVSKDQSTRFHALWKNNQSSTWHELGRPQIHGYDLQCVAFIDRFKFVSGADEKLLRIFEAPKIFLQNYYRLNKDESILKLIEESTSMPQGASVPALGLSNKAVYDDEKKLGESSEEKKPSLADELYKEVYFNKIDLNKPPSEEHLLQNTLWPEIQKLYGHGYEVFSVAVDLNTKLVASSCKASKADYANIIIWQEQSTNNQKLYKQVNSLKGHELTVVQMKFSNNGDFLLSVSRDRSWKLYKRKDSVYDFELIRSIGSKNIYHTRIVWSCDWSFDDEYFITTSRDKRACIWLGKSDDKTNNADQKPVLSKKSGNATYLELSDSITACSFAPDFISDNKSYLIAFGLDNGTIEFYTWNLDNGFEKYATIENRFSHHLSVKRLSFRKKFEKTNDSKTFCLASCSDDHTVRLFHVHA